MPKPQLKKSERIPFTEEYLAYRINLYLLKMKMETNTYLYQNLNTKTMAKLKDGRKATILKAGIGVGTKRWFYTVRLTDGRTLFVDENMKPF